MARFDVYRNAGTRADAVPFLLDVQSDLLDELDSRVVIPLRRRDRIPDVSIPERLMPEVEVDGTVCLVETPMLAAVPARLLKSRVGSLAHRQGDITAALDFLFHGF